MAKHRFFYRAEVLQIVTPDTFELLVDLGFGESKRVTVRLHNVKAWAEEHGDGSRWRKAGEWVKRVAGPGTECTIETSGRDKAGRWFAWVYPDTFTTGNELGVALVNEGHGIPAEY